MGDGLFLFSSWNKHNMSHIGRGWVGGESGKNTSEENVVLLSAEDFFFRKERHHVCESETHWAFLVYRFQTAVNLLLCLPRLLCSPHVLNTSSIFLFSLHLTSASHHVVAMSTQTEQHPKPLRPQWISNRPCCFFASGTMGIAMLNGSCHMSGSCHKRYTHT